MPIDDSTHRPNEPATSLADWPAVLATHGRWLRTVLLARLGDPLAVDDVLQNVHASVVEKGHLLRDRDKLTPWLYRIAVASALEYRRRSGRRRKLVARYAEQFPPTAHDTREPDPLDWLLAEERQSLVRRALAALPSREAEILLLKYSEDWTYQQIAEHLGLSKSAVEARLHRARQRMRRTLGTLDPSLLRI
ncbi:MAG: sigma-70 family RNA polymerase sigma factor [Pirellulales bacterium]